jgi:hypothetical protein
MNKVRKIARVYGETCRPVRVANGPLAYSGATRDQLRRVAAAKVIHGRGRMTADQLRAAVRAS